MRRRRGSLAWWRRGTHRSAQITADARHASPVCPVTRMPAMLADGSGLRVRLTLVNPRRPGIEREPEPSQRPRLSPRRRGMPVLGCQMLRQRGEKYVPLLVAGACGFLVQQRAAFPRRLPPVLLQELRYEPPPPGVVRTSQHRAQTHQRHGLVRRRLFHPTTVTPRTGRTRTHRRDALPKRAWLATLRRMNTCSQRVCFRHVFESPSDTLTPTVFRVRPNAEKISVAAGRSEEHTSELQSRP